VSPRRQRHPGRSAPAEARVPAAVGFQPDEDGGSLLPVADDRRPGSIDEVQAAIFELTHAVRPETGEPFPVAAKAKQSGAGPAARLVAADPADFDDGPVGPVDLEAGEGA
jgi:hypothetical protein